MNADRSGTPSASSHSGAGTETEVSSLAGASVKLACKLGPTSVCGNVHSMRWYKNDERIFVFSSRAKISKAENSLVSRAKLEYSQDNPEANLVIDKVELTDEGLYKCDITYVNIHDDCKGVNFINFTTLVKPENISIQDGEGIVVPDGKYGTTLTEDDDIILKCVGGRGKPVPSVQWWRGGELLKANYDEDKDDSGVGSGTNKVKIRVSRNDLNVKYECRVYHPALDSYLVKWTQLEVNVRPNKMKMGGVEHHVVANTIVMLKCDVFGSRPPANIRWFNSTTELMPESNSTKFDENDGTYNVSSTLVFRATRFENDVKFMCEAENEVMLSKGEVPLREAMVMEVLYPPIVYMTPPNYVVNETMDILLFCNYEGNPATIVDVKWFKNEEELPKDDHYIGGQVENPPLLIKNSTRDDIGDYSCSIANDVGAGKSNVSLFVDVHYKPEVNVTMDPPSPIVEDEVVNLTLSCNVMAGNPSNLLFVRWYADDQLIATLPDCKVKNSTTCVDDPSKLLLMDVSRDMSGNYSCEGMNKAGWGARSEPSELVIYYPPSGISLSFAPEKVVKRGSVTLTCKVEDLGNPSNTTYKWTRGGHTVMDVTSANWTINPVTLETNSNFSCTAINLGGQSDTVSAFISVDAPPAFIERLPPYYGALMTAKSINISCRIECSPSCSIKWMKGTVPLKELSNWNQKYEVSTLTKPPDTRTNDFQSSISTLIWKMDNWPGGMLDRMTDNANYTCQSTGNSAGPAIKSTTLFAVEYPPENLTLSNKVVNVVEGNIPEKVLCHAKAFPEASYQWRREGESDVIVKGNALILNHPVGKRNGGNYTCEAYNRHGNNSLTTFINVLFRPECGITKKEVDGKVVLVCTAQANPPEVDFMWKIKNENETIDDNIEKKGMQSILTLETRVENFRTYLCFPNNSVGVTKKPCEVDVSELEFEFLQANVSFIKITKEIFGEPVTELLPYISISSTFASSSRLFAEVQPMNILEMLPPGKLPWYLDKDIIMILVAILAGIILVIIIVAIIICIVCRKKKAADKYNTPVELEDRENTPMTGAKWPMRPGVLVHVNTNHSLLSATPDGRSPNESQASRASRIRAMFGPDQPGGSLPGVFHSKSGVVTFKRLEPSSESNSLNRKRKSPGGPAGPATNGTKDPASPNDVLLPGEADKAFYENLPFHNMANPQQKRMMNGEPSTGSRHHHHTHHSGGRTRRKHHRRSEMDNCRYRPGSAPASPPPGNRYVSPDSPPQQAPYQPPHYPTYTAPRSKADYTFIKFHDVGQEIDV